MVEFEPVGNMVLASGTPDEVYDVTDAVMALFVALVEPVRVPLRDASTGSTVATVDSLVDIELTMELDPYAGSEVRCEALAETGAAVVSEPEGIRVAFPLPVVSVVCGRISLVVAEVVGAVPATPGRVMPEALLTVVTELAVFNAELYEDNDAPDRPCTSDDPEEVVVAAVPIAIERATPGGTVVEVVDDIVLSADESDEVVGRIDSAVDDMPVKLIVSRDAELGRTEIAVPRPE